jgi:hypothetical protein
MQPFDLERFKAGEPAYHGNDKNAHLYFGELPDGKIVTKIKFSRVWYTSTWTLDVMNNNFYMKERELTWEDVYEMWEKMDSRTYSNIKWLIENCEPPKLKKK